MNEGFDDMRIKLGNYVNNNMFTIKHPIYEIVDINSPIEKNKFRTFSDATTSAYVNTYIENTDIRHKFIDYTYSLVYTKLQTLMNPALNNENFESLHDKEAVYFYFKGGNIMYELTKGKLLIKDASTIDNIKNKNDVYAKIVNSMSNKEIIDDIEKVLKSNLKISDVDYSVIIIAHNYQRYLILKQFVLRILAFTLEEISLFFDNLYIDKFEHDGSPTLPSVKLDKEKYKYINNILKKVKKDNNYRLPSDFDEKSFFDINNIYILATLYNIIYTKFGMKSRNKLNDILDRINKLVEHKKLELVKTKFYTLEKQKIFLEKIVEEYKEINKENKIYYKMADVNNYNQYKLSKIPNIDNLSIDKRDDFVIKCNNDIHTFYDKVNLNANMKYHYITLNDTIYTMNQQGQQIVNFSLIRIKLNTVINNCIQMKTPNDDNFKMTSVKIPSEFVDISVSDFDINFVHEKCDYNESHLNFVTLNRPYVTDDELVEVWSYNFKQVFDDLSNTLFIQKTYMPWLDAKYQKRIIRMLLFSYIDLINNRNIFKDLLDFSSVAYSTLTDNLQYPYERVKNMLGLQSYDNTSIDTLLKTIVLKNMKIVNIGNNSTYNYFKDLINVIIVYMYLLDDSKINDEEFLNFANNINKINNIPDITKISSYKAMAKEHIINMLTTIIKYGEPLYESYVILKNPPDSEDIVASPLQDGNFNFSNLKSIKDFRFVPKIKNNLNALKYYSINDTVKCNGVICTYRDIIDIEE